jgi:RNA recognition motif-containing protein
MLLGRDGICFAKLPMIFCAFLSRGLRYNGFLDEQMTMKLLVRNLSRSTTEEELKQLFEEIGQVQSCDLVLDSATGASKGFGFVEMPRASQAMDAVKKLNGMELANSKIRVKRAEAKKEPRVKK